MARSTLCGDTGNGATIAFASGITATYKVRRITLPTVNGERIDCSDISTTPGPRKYITGDLFDVDAIEVEVIVDTFDPVPTIHTNCGLVTVTFPTRTGETTPMTYAATCFVMGVTPPVLANGELQVMTIRLQPDGATPFVYTKAT